MLTGWKTLLYSLAVSTLGVLTATDWTTVLNNPKTAGIVVTLIGIGGAILRFFTNTSVGSKTGA